MKKTLLHIEQLEGMNMNVKIEGDPTLLVNMIKTAMDQKQDIAATMIAGVMAWADKNEIPRDQLGNMVIFHK